MPLANTKDRYGTITKIFHWLIVILFANQYIVANIMIPLEPGESFLGLTEGPLYQWHKSIGILIFFVAVLRFTWRKTTRLPSWAAGLSDWEKGFIHWYERLLYAAMFIMPLSGYIFVEAGGYGLPGLPRWLPRNELLSVAGEIVHIITGYAIVVAITCHLALVVKRQTFDSDGYIRRMLLGTSQN